MGHKLSIGAGVGLSSGAVDGVVLVGSVTSVLKACETTLPIEPPNAFQTNCIKVRSARLGETHAHNFAFVCSGDCSVLSSQLCLVCCTKCQSKQ